MAVAQRSTASLPSPQPPVSRRPTLRPLPCWPTAAHRTGAPRHARAAPPAAGRPLLRRRARRRRPAAPAAESGRTARLQRAGATGALGRVSTSGRVPLPPGSAPPAVMKLPPPHPAASHLSAGTPGGAACAALRRLTVWAVVEAQVERERVLESKVQVRHALAGAQAVQDRALPPDVVHHLVPACVRARGHRGLE